MGRSTFLYCFECGITASARMGMLISPRRERIFASVEGDEEQARIAGSSEEW